MPGAGKAPAPREGHHLERRREGIRVCALEPQVLRRPRPAETRARNDLAHGSILIPEWIAEHRAWLAGQVLHPLLASVYFLLRFRKRDHRQAWVRHAVCTDFMAGSKTPYVFL